MFYVVYDTHTGLVAKTYTTERGAEMGKRAMIKRDAMRTSRSATDRWNQFVKREYQVLTRAEYERSVRCVRQTRPHPRSN